MRESSRASIIVDCASEYFEAYLFARITNQQALRLTQEEDDPSTFRYEAVDAVLGFDLPEEGEAGDARAVTLFQNGMEIRSERVE